MFFLECYTKLSIKKPVAVSDSRKRTFGLVTMFTSSRFKKKVRVYQPYQNLKKPG